MDEECFAHSVEGTGRTIQEVKNAKNLSLTLQLQGSIDLARAQGKILQLFIRPTTKQTVFPSARSFFILRSTRPISLCAYFDWRIFVRSSSVAPII
ncbi:MAG: hypothetical protein LBQ80_03220 [Clostridium sp.]|nr:hypothetical protein [Clostridium sp.]